jgi:starvation-inducible DNA-binding protein
VIAPTPTPNPDRVEGTVADGLARLLADTYTLYLRTHGYHWNVTGPQFRSLHLMFEEQYLEMAQLASVGDEAGAPEAMEMVRRLLAANEAVVRTAKAVVRAAEDVGDPASQDLATRRIAVHEKAIWMLRATASR